MSAVIFPGVSFSETPVTAIRWSYLIVRSRASSMSHALQKIDKQRRADERRNGADRKFARRDDRAGYGVGNDHKQRTAKRRRGNCDAIVTAERQSNEMRND